MLNCGGPTADDPICVPDSGKFPAKDVPDFGILANSGWCPSVFSRQVSEPAKLGLQTDDGRFCTFMILHEHSLFFLPCTTERETIVHGVILSVCWCAQLPLRFAAFLLSFSWGKKTVLSTLYVVHVSSLALAKSRLPIKRRFARWIGYLHFGDCGAS